MMKGALENVEVLHFFFISVLCGDLVPPPHSPPPPQPTVIVLVEMTRRSGSKEWWEEGGLDGKWTTPIKRIRLISGCGIAYRCEQVHCRPTRFRLSLAGASHALYHPHTQHPIHLAREGRRGESSSCRNDKVEVKQLCKLSFFFFALKSTNHSATWRRRRQRWAINCMM